MKTARFNADERGSPSVRLEAIPEDPQRVAACPTTRVSSGMWRATRALASRNGRVRGAAGGNYVCDIQAGASTHLLRSGAAVRTSSSLYRSIQLQHRYMRARLRGEQRAKPFLGSLKYSRRAA